MTAKTDIRGIVFDKDGVLVDFEETWINVLLDMANELASDNGTLNNTLLAQAGYDDKSHGFTSGSVWAAGTTADLVECWLGHLPNHNDQSLFGYINKQCLDISAVPLHGVEPLQKLFKDLTKSDLKLGITTNDLEGAAVKTMNEFGLTPYLSLICGFDSVENPKPAGDPVFAFCDICGLKPEQVLVIGDNVHDLEMAANSNAGLAVGVLTGNSTRKELTPFADHVIETVLDLKWLLQQIKE